MLKLLNLDDLIAGAGVKTQKALGEKAGVDQRTISRWRKGAPVDVDAVAKMVKVAQTPAQIQDDAGDIFIINGTKDLDAYTDAYLRGGRDLSVLVAWLSRWAPGIGRQVDDGHEVADIVVDFMDPSKWNPETIKLKQYIKAGLPNLERLIELMHEVPDESDAESAA